MKKLGLLALGATLIIGTLAGCGSNKEVNNTKTESINSGTLIIEDLTLETNEVIDYNDKITNLTIECQESEDLIWTLYDAYDEDNTSFKVEDIENAITNTIKICNDNRQEVNNVGNWDGDSSLKDGALEFMSNQIEYYQKFNELLPYLTKGDFTEDEKAIHDSLQSEIKSIDKDLRDASRNLSVIQKEFAKKYNFELDGGDETNEGSTNDEPTEENIPSEEISE